MVFDVRIKATKERGEKLRSIVEKKMADENRRALNETVEAIILEYGEMKQAGKGKR